MPEIGEITLFSNLINYAGETYSFSQIENKSKHPNISIPWPVFNVKSECRGKELALIFSPIPGHENSNSGDEVESGAALHPKSMNSVRVQFHFGLTGMFHFTKSDEIPKSPKLIIHTSCKNHTLVFADSRGFGKWVIAGAGQLWDSNRGPDPIKEYETFRANILNKLSNKIFNVAICESMLNQQFFNGIGNYLRAEILFRADINPFKPARDVLNELNQAPCKESIKELGATNQSSSDLLQLCRDVPEEVIKLEVNKYAADNSNFVNWCLCYDKPDMHSKKDKNGRLIWYNPKYDPSLDTGIINFNQKPPPSKKLRGSGVRARGSGRHKDTSNAEPADISINSKVVYDSDDDDSNDIL